MAVFVFRGPRRQLPVLVPQGHVPRDLSAPKRLLACCCGPCTYLACIVTVVTLTSDSQARIDSRQSGIQCNTKQDVHRSTCSRMCWHDVTWYVQCAASNIQSYSGGMHELYMRCWAQQTCNGSNSRACKQAALLVCAYRHTACTHALHKIVVFLPSPAHQAIVGLGRPLTATEPEPACWPAGMHSTGHTAHYEGAACHNTTRTHPSMPHADAVKVPFQDASNSPPRHMLYKSKAKSLLRQHQAQRCGSCSKVVWWRRGKGHRLGSGRVLQRERPGVQRLAAYPGAL